MLTGTINLLLLLLALSYPVVPVKGDAADDLITDLPGLTFDPGFKQYSGYLHTPSGNNLHYWLVESQNNPATDPLLLWLNGGPGCSSLNGLLTELGPFRVNQDGRTLFENVYAWNKGANVIFLESPRSVGFSYRDPGASPDNVYNDDKTAEDNADALVAFLERFPQYRGRPFFVTGESYGGVYIPALVNLLVQRIEAGTITGLNLVGMAIGNGYLNAIDQFNSVIDLFYWRGMIGMDQFNALAPCCELIGGGGQPLAYCNFSSFVDWSSGEPKNFNTSLMNQCAQNVIIYSNGNNLNDAYNSYQDCYMDTVTPLSLKALRVAKQRRNWKQSRLNIFAGPDTGSRFVDEGARINIGSTDAQYGYPCWMDETMDNYLNLPEVRKALHIPTFVQAWEECSDLNYDEQYYDMAPFFESMDNAGYPLQILIYNGDLDTVCEFLGDEWFTLRLVQKLQMSKSPRYAWTFQESSKYIKQIGGYRQNFTDGVLSIDLVTVKGAGHLVPLDRGGPALQMITNFVQNINFNTSLFWDTTPKPTLSQYKPKPAKNLTRKELDRVWSLPGLTYTPNFKQYSGYLHGVPGDYLHYWLVESQSSPETDPLVLWLNGGPGCSSIGGFFSENGPFHPNPDGTTLFENIYSWNKVANVLYLESPRNVGFSYQNTSINPDPSYNDRKTARGSFLALMDFLSVFPEYKNRPFYITGESYCGIYIPTLTAYAIEHILAGKAPGLNLVGIAIGNGELSKKQQLNSIMSMLYYRGVYGYDLYEELMSCCPNKTQPAAYCDFSQYVYFDGGFAYPLNPNSTCGQLIVSYGSYYIWFHQIIQDVYNLYEDGYRLTPLWTSPADLQQRMKFGSRNLRMFSKLANNLVQSPNQLSGASLYADRRSKINYDSTDGKGNFYWYQQTATPNYLNIPDVRAALHIPTFVGEWTDCNLDINENYNQQWDDTTPLFQYFFNSSYPLRILIYNGDIDTACDFLGDEWFIEDLASMYSMPVNQSRTEWIYQSQRAGYWKQFVTPTGTIDLVTVKGAGHFVPLDRPGPALQMINNFLTEADYSTALPFPIAITPLKKEYIIEEQIAAAPNNSASNRAKRSTQGEGTRKQRMSQSNAGGLPLAFQLDFPGYAGYLDNGHGDKLFYWLLQPSASVSQKPLILWLADGPGCSAMYDTVNTIGPIRLSSEGNLGYQNPYSWIQVASVLFLEAAPGIGFSSAQTQQYNDDKIVSGLDYALNQFFEAFPNYNNSAFYIFGKGYGGICALMLADQFQSKVVSLRGVGLENALLNYDSIVNTAANEMYFSGLLGKSEWDELIPCCMQSNGEYDENCNLSQFVVIDGQGKISPKNYSSPTLQLCANLIADYSTTALNERIGPSGNMYRNCYEGAIPINPELKPRKKRSVGHLSGLPLTNIYPFINQQDRINYRSTDPFASYPCYMDYATNVFFNLAQVQSVLRVENVTNWQQCNPSFNYTRQYFDTTEFFNSLLKKQLRIIIFDGDSHLQNNFLANEIFVETWAKNKLNGTTSEVWTYQESTKYRIQYAGYLKTFYSGSNSSQANFTLDLLTVKGAGYHVAQDRPAPALQMISNYLSSRSYSTVVPVEPTSPLLDAYTPAPVPEASRMEADRIYDLPGLTYQINFNQYSGYLKAATSDAYLHYWFVESQNNPAIDPLIIWFNGGPGCSSLGGLLSENGPFRANPDGRTLFENVFSWNKLANVLYIESPYNVGFSYREPQNVTFSWDDDMTANDAYTAIKDFFTVFPQYQSHDLYISGESYGGVYVPTLTALLVQKINAGESFNLKGMIVGNGYVSVVQNIRSLPSYMYFHGIYGKDTWDKLMTCCPNVDEKQPITHCDFDEYVEMLSNGDVVPRSGVNQTCAQLVSELAYDRVWNTMNYVYNLYQDCYQQTIPILTFSAEQHRKKTLELLMEKNTAKLHTNMGIAYMKAMPWGINTFSTDHTGGFPCFMMHSVTSYLNQPHVRDALHIPDYVQEWSFCSDPIGSAYVQQYNDTTQFFQSMFDSNYPLRMLIYNGDVDTACGIFEAEWFIEAFAKINNMTASSRDPWLYQLSSQFSPQIGGYHKLFNGNNLSIELITVKGAGHMVPTDRAGPMLQLLTNFVKQRDYNDAIPFSFERQPLLPQYNVY